MDEIVLPTIREMARRGTPYQGVLYAGLMIKDGQARLVEYNARFGDPETQVLMMRLGAQALDLLLATAAGSAGHGPRQLGRRSRPDRGDGRQRLPRPPIRRAQSSTGSTGCPRTAATWCFTPAPNSATTSITANGGRVLNITARGDSLTDARNRAYAMIDLLDWPEGFCRSDIGWRAL